MAEKNHETPVLTGEMADRRRKMEELRRAGIDPFGKRFSRTHLAREILDEFAGVEDFDAVEKREVRIAGRIVSLRTHGKASFAHLLDLSGQIQVYAKIDALGDESYQRFTSLDLGDIIGVAGTVFRTRRGEITVEIKEWEILSKALRPLPEKWHGLKDVDLRYRKRYLDLIANPETREVFRRRSAIISAIRRFLDEKGFLEVETPILSLIAGGGHARPFTTHHNALDLDLYLRIALELYHKRLIVGGLEKVYEIGRCFRNEGISTKHNPEFTMLELYQAYADLSDMMELAEALISTVAQEVLGTHRLEYQGVEIDLTPPWPRLSMMEAIRAETGLDWLAIESDEEAVAAGEKLGLDLTEKKTKAQVLDELLSVYIEPKLTGPVFLTDYPVEISPLAKKKADNPRLTDRFELFIYGWEMANAFTELNDPLDQRERFVAQAREKAKGNEEAMEWDEDFLVALEHGMPPTGGMGIGIDRLVMILTGAVSIRDVLLFPLMRPKND
ncbi:MAG: lysine--tRNA ligase [Firmicutes bacterium]|jgi:lysyl-tRNA synthetase class 2|nr:lysine--tRNA ligase [Bacillota bacterium]